MKYYSPCRAAMPFKSIISRGCAASLFTWCFFEDISTSPFCMASRASRVGMMPESSTERESNKGPQPTALITRSLSYAAR